MADVQSCSETFYFGDVSDYSGNGSPNVFQTSFKVGSAFGARTITQPLRYYQRGISAHSHWLKSCEASSFRDYSEKKG